MWPFTKKSFNAVVEGTAQDDWMTLNYKLTRIEVPENVVVLNDGVYKYKLHGRTEDFENVQVTNAEAGDLEAKINFLGFCEGVVLPYCGGISNFLQRPRAICMRDGRVYIDENMATDDSYVNAVSLVVKTAGEIFSEQKLSKLYSQVASKGLPKGISINVSKEKFPKYSHLNHFFNN
ncbi:hypothetical protein COV11_02265 [Candidatus Woesearchaeota archaeon CG10_big_fil_rev_8_21_14_0_10_30_7]|nr:MAG: hypothetical protein COV11_02265 [Candidatus Woesearchaeota archaeon CG10_big_fil_rev_8_21_14_0_10_30_7]